MFKKSDKIYYIDLFDGIVKESIFIEHDNNGMWIKIKGNSANTFVYSNIANERIFSESTSATSKLESIRNKTKENLKSTNKFVEDVVNKLKTHEGNFYAGIINEILRDKINF